MLLEKSFVKDVVTKSKNVLVVEDDPYWQFKIENSLKDFDKDMHIECVSSAEQAEQKMAKNKIYDVIIADHYLDGNETGLDLWKKCHDKMTHQTFLMISGIKEIDFRNMAPDKDLVYLEKPLDTEKFYGVLTEQMNKNQWDFYDEIHQERIGFFEALFRPMADEFVEWMLFEDYQKADDTSVLKEVLDQFREKYSAFQKQFLLFMRYTFIPLIALTLVVTKVVPESGLNIENLLQKMNPIVPSLQMAPLQRQWKEFQFEELQRVSTHDDLQSPRQQKMDIRRIITPELEAQFARIVQQANEIQMITNRLVSERYLPGKRLKFE